VTLCRNKVAEADLNRIVTERSDRQFAGMVTRGLDDLFADLLNNVLQLLK